MRKSNIVSRLRKFLSCSDGGPHITSHPIGVDVREEYANAFRTESYIDFWTRVLTVTAQVPVESTTATRLSSYRLFAEHLLDPTQPTVKRMLNSAHLRPNSYSLLSDYFSHTANASLLCSRLLKDIDHLRQNTKFDNEFSISNTHKFNPFVPSPSSVQVIQNGCSKLLKRLEFGRDKARAKLKRVKYLQHSSAGLLLALTASLIVIVVTHGVALFVVAPGLFVASIELGKSRKLAKMVARVLDVAAKGTYTLNRDFDTVRLLVARLSHEIEHMRVIARFWLERGKDQTQAIGEIARQLKLSHASFSQQLDEVEEHLYLCFMTINRARNLVVKEIMDSPQPAKVPYSCL